MGLHQIVGGSGPRCSLWHFDRKDKYLSLVKQPIFLSWISAAF